jgi:hypothetical protein
MADLEKGTTNHTANAGTTGFAGGGQFQAGHSYTPRPTPIGNPGALGLFSFAGTTLLLSFINVQTHSVTTPNVVVGMAIFVGGLAQLLAGMWEFPRGNQFGGTGEFPCSFRALLACFAFAPPLRGSVFACSRLQSAVGWEVIIPRASRWLSSANSNGAHVHTWSKSIPHPLVGGE